MRKIAILVNPNSTTNKRQLRFRERVTRQLGELGDLVITESAEDAERYIRQIHDEKVDLLITSGGDGTTMHLYDTWFNTFGYEETPPPVLPLAGGAQNCLPREVGTWHPRFDWYGERQLRKKLDWICSKYGEVETFSRNLIRVEDDTIGHPQYTFIYSDGLFVRAIANYYEQGSGVMPAVREFAAVLSQAFLTGEAKPVGLFAPSRARAYRNGEEPLDDYLAFLITTLDKTILSLKLFPEPNCTGEGFHVFTLRNKGLRKDVVRFLERTLLRRPHLSWHGPAVATSVEDRLEIRDCEGYALDGEIYLPPPGSCNVKLSLGPLVPLVRL